MNSKKNLVEKSKTAKPKAVAKPAKKASVEKPKAVAKPKAVSKPTTTKKVSVEQLNKKRIWKGGDRDSEIIIPILKGTKNELLELLNKIKKDDLSKTLIVDHVLKLYFNNKKAIEYDLMYEKKINEISHHLGSDVEKKVGYLIDLLNLIKSIYNLNFYNGNTGFTSEFDKSASVTRVSSSASNGSSVSKTSSVSQTSSHQYV